MHDQEQNEVGKTKISMDKSEVYAAPMKLSEKMVDEVNDARKILETMESSKLFTSPTFVKDFKSRKDKISNKLRPAPVVFSCDSTKFGDTSPSSLCYSIINHKRLCQKL